MSEVEAILVAHNAGSLLQAAVGSVLEDVLQQDVVVVDNSSSDGSVTRLEERYPQIRVLAQPNRGFAAGNNAGILATTAPMLLLLNPDAEMSPGSIRVLARYMRENPAVGVVGPEVLNTDGSRQAGSRGAYPSLRQVLHTRVRCVWGRLRGNRSLSPAALHGPTPFPWITGAAMLVRRRAIEDVGMMDDGFFLYFEDVDWCHRMHDAGWDVVVVPDARVVHHLGQSAATPGFAAQKYRESFYRYCDKYGLHWLSLVRRTFFDDSR